MTATPRPGPADRTKAAEDTYPELLRSLTADRVRLIELRDRARRKASAARVESHRLLEMAAQATERAEAILLETETRLARRRARGARPSGGEAAST